MKVKELLLPLVLAVSTTFILQYFFSSKKANVANTPTSGQRFTAPGQEDAQLYKPLVTEVDFIDKPSYRKPVVSVIETDLARYQFSTDGASLEQFEFKRQQEKNKYLTTIFAPAGIEKEKRCFLVAFAQRTPYYYALQNVQDVGNAYEIIYEVETHDVIVHKKFTIYKNSYQIDLTMSLEPISGPVQPRIFFPSPVIPALGQQDIVKAIVADAQDKIHFYDNSQETLQGYWVQPTLFGCQDRYFVHALVKDAQSFIQRGYFKIFEHDALYVIAEGTEVKSPTSWTVSFYMGPKESTACQAVDNRLIQTLNYGFLAPISRPVSTVLLQILNFIYQYVHNYGWAIIILTILMKLLLLPLSWKGDQSMKKRLEFQKKLDYIQSKYKHDKDALYVAREELVRQHGMPGLSGCFPMLLQVPLFIALSWVLSNSIELYQAPFLWIPDLASPDPYYILPIFLAISMVFHMSSLGGRDAKQKLVTMIMALIFTAFMTTFSAGLVLYIIVGTALGVMQTALTNKLA